MSNAHGEHIWYELLTSDPDAAGAFYTDVLGWSIAPAGMEGIDYRIISAPDGMAVAGLMKMPDGMGDGPIWLGYVGVDDVDRTVAELEAAGGQVHMPAVTMEGVGRMAMVADPQGAVFYVMRGESGERSEAFADRTGHAMWNELATSDPDAAADFYKRLFGWTKGGVMPMGEMGDYQFIHHGEAMIGAIMPLVMGRERPIWTYCFGVDDIDAAHARVKEAGGTPDEDPMEVPGGAYVFSARDPQGAHFYLGGPRK